MTHAFTPTGLAIGPEWCGSRTTTSPLLGTGVRAHQALTQGLQLGLRVAAALEVINVVIAAVSPRIAPHAEPAAAALSA
jgi:hypothetical protein